MGSSSRLIAEGGNKRANFIPEMKAFVAIALAAAAQAAPESQPEAHHGGPHILTAPYTGVYSAGAYGTHLLVNPATYTTGLNTPVVTTVATKGVVPTVVRSPAVYNFGVHTPLATGYSHMIKREADPEAQPEAHHGGPHILTTSYNGVYGAGLYGHQLVNPAVTYTAPLVSNVATVGAKPIVPTVVKTPVVSYNYGVHTPLTTGYTGYAHLIKREAEADPLTIVNPYTTGLYGNVHGAGVLNTHHMVNPVTYTTPVVSTVNAALPTVVKTPVVSYNYGINAPLTTGYTHLIKREAQPEAEADPAVLINGAYPSVYGAGLYGHQLVNPAVTYTTPLVPNVAGYTGYTGLYY